MFCLVWFLKTFSTWENLGLFLDFIPIPVYDHTQDLAYSVDAAMQTQSGKCFVLAINKVAFLPGFFLSKIEGE